MKKIWAYLLAILVSIPVWADEGDKPLSEQVVEYAKTFIGTPYKLGAAGPSQFDCSSYTTYVFKHFGYDIPA